MEEHLVSNILHTWYPKVIDPEGGFYANYDYRWQRSPVQEKHIVTQARGLWTASEAAKRFLNDSRFSQAAEHGFKYLRDVMWDVDNGGFFSVIGQERISGTWSGKHSYGNAFSIYALSSYYSLTGDESALELAKNTFFWLEKEAYDSEAGGYFNFIPQKGQISRSDIPCPSASHDSQIAAKDSNSTLHLLEALTELYLVWPDALVASRLQELLTVLTEVIPSKRGYLKLHFDRNWRPKTFEETSAEIINENLGSDHISFGHDVEAAMLIVRATRALAPDDFDTRLTAAKQLVDHVLAYGVDPSNAGIYYGAYYYPGDLHPKVVMKAKAWWPQAEGLLCFKLFSQLFPSDPRYQMAFSNLWTYIKHNVVDYENGDWYCEGLDDSPHAKFEPKAHAWKCNYHNSRALMWCLDLSQGIENF